MTEETSGPLFENNGYCEICDSEVRFIAWGEWLRDLYLCSRCECVPRERALMRAIKRFKPNYRQIAVHESSPAKRGVSSKLLNECEAYSYSFYFPDSVPGAFNEETGGTCENIEKMTLEDESVDLFVTQDVFEHINDPVAAFSEVERVLRKGGAHIFTVPIVRGPYPSERRAFYGPNGISHFKEPEYHGDPIDENGALVTFDYGYDIVEHIYKTGMTPIVLDIVDWRYGIKAELNEVIVSIKK